MDNIYKVLGLQLQHYMQVAKRGVNDAYLDGSANSCILACTALMADGVDINKELEPYGVQLIFDSATDVNLVEIKGVLPDKPDPEYAMKCQNVAYEAFSKRK